MAVTTAYPPGTFCWSELSTTDPEAAKRFYGELLGWQAKDIPLGPDAGVYSMMQVDGHDAAALYTQPADQKAAGVPPHWRAYVAVSDADEAARRIADAGGTVLAQPFDVFDSGRMAVARDPGGAVLAVWEARKHVGAGWSGEPGAMAWNELLTRDTATASQFYARAFGWAAEAQSGPMPYTIFKSGGRQVGGMMMITDEMLKAMNGDVVPHWHVYFAVGDCDAAAARAASMGAKVAVPPMDVPGAGRLATLEDPQGASFSIIKGEPPATET